jgi:hypothetical protein
MRKILKANYLRAIPIFLKCPTGMSIPTSSVRHTSEGQKQEGTMKALLQSQTNSSLYAAHGDFCRIFGEDMAGLYFLALLLTADSVTAEQCFVAGFEDSVHSNRVFKQWAHSWSRRTIIKSAIRMVQPTPSAASSTKVVERAHEDASELHASTAAILALEGFDRFVYVMSVLEGYSNQDCATLLNCTRQDVVAARTRTLQLLANAQASQTVVEPVQIFETEKSLPLGGAA